MELNLTATLTEEAREGESETVALDYPHPNHEGRYVRKEIKISEGKLIMIVNALMDYADIWEEYLEQERETLNAYQAEMIRVEAKRFRDVAKELQEKIGYDRERAIERCQKKRKKAKNDIGEEAVALAVRKARKKEPEEPREEKEESKPKGRERSEETINVLDLV